MSWALAISTIFSPIEPLPLATTTGALVLFRNAARSRAWIGSLMSPDPESGRRGPAPVCGGVPSRTTMSPGLSSARVSAWLSSTDAGAELLRRRRPLRPHPHESLVAVQRDQRMHGAGRLDVEREARPPDLLGGIGDSPAPSREISNCAIAVPCGVAKGISKFHCGAAGSMRWPLASARSGSEATCSKVCRAIAASVSSSR